jgi:hypothetical protein
MMCVVLQEIRIRLHANYLPYCLILDDDFSTFNESAWSREVGVGGFG